MRISMTRAAYLLDRKIGYDLVTHPATMRSSGSAKKGHVPSSRLAKAVVLKGTAGYLLAVLPASHRIQIAELRALLGDNVDLANEEQIETLFGDCERGAVPAIGAAYGLKVVMDDSLANEPDVYFEGGDHASLVHVSGANFRSLMAGAKSGRFREGNRA